MQLGVLLDVIKITVFVMKYIYLYIRVNTTGDTFDIINPSYKRHIIPMTSMYAMYLIKWLQQSVNGLLNMETEVAMQMCRPCKE